VAAPLSEQQETDYCIGIARSLSGCSALWATGDGLLQWHASLWIISSGLLVVG